MADENNNSDSTKESASSIADRAQAKLALATAERQLAEATGLRAEALRALNKQNDANIGYQQDILAALIDQKTPINERLAALRKQIDLEREKNDLSADGQTKLETLIRLEGDLTAARQDGGAAARQLIDTLKEQNRITEERAKIVDEGNAAMSEQIAKLGITEKAFLTLRDPMAMFQKSMAAIVGVTIEATKAYDGARAELMKLSGGSAALNGVLADTIQAGARAGLTFKEASKGVIVLATSMAVFTELSGDVQRELGRTAGVFERFGISVGENMNIATKGMGFTAKEANNLQMELFAVGTALGPDMQQAVMKEFGPAMKELGAFTKEHAIKVFKQLAAQAKATGMSISELTGLAKKFDTYDSAAESVGRLNSILGGDYLNSIQMLNASEGDRIKMLQNSLKMSGRQFSDLSRFEKKALAATVGITDMTQAMKLFGTSSENMEMMRKKAEAAGMTLEEFEARSKASNDITKQFKLILQELAIVAKPIITILMGIAKFLAMIVEVPFIKWGLAITAVLVGLATVAGTVTAAIAPMLLATGTAPAALVALGKAVAVSGTMILAGAKGFAFLGVSLLSIGGGILMAGAGFLLLAIAVERLVKTGPALLQFAAGIVVLAGAMAVLGAFGLLGGIFGAIGGGVMAAFILGIGTAMAFISSDTVNRMTAMASAVSTLGTALKEIESVKADVVINTVKVFESIGNIKASSGLAAEQAIESFRKAVIDVRAQSQIQLEMTIHHNNVKATEDSFKEFTKNLNKALNKGMM